MFFLKSHEVKSVIYFEVCLLLLHYTVNYQHVYCTYRQLLSEIKTQNVHSVSGPGGLYNSRLHTLTPF